MVASCNEKDGRAGKRFAVKISGAGLEGIKNVRRASCVAPKAAAQGPHCAGFKIERVAHASYFGFQLDGNGRCLMNDFVVTHNVSGARSNTRVILRTEGP